MKGWYLTALLFMYFFIAALTFMNMLIGIVVDNMSDASRQSKDEGDRQRFSSRLLQIFQQLDQDFDNCISEPEFRAVMENEPALKLLTSMGIDVHSLIEECPMIFESLQMKDLEFDDFVAVLWQFRPSLASAIRALSTMRATTHSQLAAMFTLLVDIGTKAGVNIPRVKEIGTHHTRHFCLQKTA